MNETEILDSLNHTALTTGAGANCFFQGFIHTLCYLHDSKIVESMNKYPGTAKLIEVFNRKVPGCEVSNIKDLITLASAMHPLERELIFGPVMRDTLNELNLKGPSGESLSLEKDSIIYPPHAIAFVHAFGFSFDEYTHKNDSESMNMPIKELQPAQVGDYYS